MITRVGAVVALVTGIATIIGGIVSGWSTVWHWGLPIAGLIPTGFYLAVGIVLVFWSGPKHRWEPKVRWERGRRVLSVLLPLGFIVAVGYLRGSTSEQVLRAVGGGAWIFSLLLIYWAAVDLNRARRASLKQCPDCAETIKSAARVCRYCGHRFADASSSGDLAGAKSIETASRVRHLPVDTMSQRRTARRPPQ